MAAEWLEVLRLDAASVAASAEPLMAVEEFETVAEAALGELPLELLDQLNAVAILIADRPSPEMVADGLDPRILGLYHGVPMTKRSVSFGAPWADTIHLFRANLEARLAHACGAARTHPRGGPPRDGPLLRLHGGAETCGAWVWRERAAHRRRAGVREPPAGLVWLVEEREQ